MSELLHQCMTKATTAEGDNFRYSLNWAVSRRGTLRVYTDRLECGDWDIPYREMDEAILFSARQMFIPCYILQVKAHGRTYQFGLNPGKFWAGNLPFPVRRETASLRYSWFSITIRVVAVIALAYLLWKRLF